MATIESALSQNGLAGRKLGLVERLADRARAWALYRRTYAELSALPDGMLADLGTNRSELKHLARTAAYGN